MMPMSQKTGVPSWDLSDLYRGHNDPKILADLGNCKKRAEKFADEYRGKIISGVFPSFIFEALREYENILQDEAKAPMYASLLVAENTGNTIYQALAQKTEELHIEIINILLFFGLELLKLSEDELRVLALAPELKNYSHYLAVLAKQRPHVLTEAEERIMNDKELTGGVAWSKLFDKRLGTRAYGIANQDKKIQLGIEELLHSLYNHDREKRKQAQESLTEGLKEDTWFLSAVFNVMAHDQAIDDRYRKFGTPEASRHLANEITQEMVDTMTAVAVGNYSIAQDFYRMKREALGLTELYDYDRYAPFTAINREFNFSEARDMVLGAFQKFSPVYAATANKFFENNWIHAAMQTGKRGGAFCSYITPDKHPYVFLNYQGGIKDVLTLAHELGHGVHAYLAGRKHSYLTFDTPLTMAETASVFGEMLLFDSLKDALNDSKEKFALYANKLEEIFATVFRQTAMYRFEKAIHSRRREKGELALEEINALWRASQTEMFGDSITITPNYDWWWSYIPHFVHTPFYVYAYAFGELLVLSLYARYRKEGSAFADKYIWMLSAGGSKSPEELVSPFGIDLKKREFWEEGIGVIKELVEELKRIKKAA